MFWKKQKCNHDWHHLQDAPISDNYGLDIDDGCYIFCSQCDKEELVSIRYWERLKKKQEIMKD
jgi:hypothetical protein